jgi:hypothetical protein
VPGFKGYSPNFEAVKEQVSRSYTIAPAKKEIDQNAEADKVSVTREIRA